MATPTTLPATAVAGEVLTASYVNNLRGAFRVLQVVTATYATGVSSSVGGYFDTGLSATITPSSTSSKVLVILNQAGVAKSAGNTGLGVIISLNRGATQVFFPATGASFTGTAVQNVTSVGGVYLDSPATTSAVTYKTQFANLVAAASVTVQASVGSGFAESSICLMEISA
jgi:hypothetical protein